MNVTATVLAALLLVAGQAEADNTPTRLANFVVSPIYDVRVPAREPGALAALDVRKGQVVKAGQVMGRVDDSDAKVRKVIAENELKVAETQAASDADLKAAIATIGVAQAEWEGSKKIKSVVDDAVSEFQVRRDKLTYERSKYNADTTKVEYEVSQLTRGMRLAQLEAVNNEIKRRQIEAPIEGVVMERYHNIGEWAQAGEPIYRVVHMDRLRIEGMLNAADLTPEEIAAKPSVTIYVKTPRMKGNERGEVVFKAKIDFISQVVDHSGEFLISAEFDNPRTVNGETVQWSVRPGLEAEASLDPELMKTLHERRMKRRSRHVRSFLDDERVMSARQRK